MTQTLIEQAVLETWGERCPDFNPECCTCRAWAELDGLATRLEQADKLLEGFVRTQWMLETIARTHSTNFAEVHERILANRPLIASWNPLPVEGEEG